MHIRNEQLRKAYYTVKAAEVVERIRQVEKEKHDDGKLVEPSEEDDIKGVPESGVNKDETELSVPTEHNTPADPEFTTNDIISGTGSGPSMESRTNYN